MRATFLHAPGDVRVADAPMPTIQRPTDAVVRVSATCVCGSDLWSYRGISPVDGPKRIGHEYCGVVVEVGSDVRCVQAGQFVVGPFFSCDNTCPHCRAGFQSACDELEWYVGCQAEFVRVPNADGTLVATPAEPPAELVASLLACSDVFGTGWHAARMAGVQAGMTVAVVGDGAVGLCGVIAAGQLGADRIIAMSRHATRQRLARDFGATDIVADRGDAGVEHVQDLTGGIGADAVLECVGTGSAMEQAIGCARPGAIVGFVGVPHGVELPVRHMYAHNVGVRGGVAAVREYLPHLIELVWSGAVEPGRVFDLSLPLESAAAGYAAMDRREAIKALLRP